MTATITSKFSNPLWAGLIFFVFLISLLIGVIASLADTVYSISAVHQIRVTLVILIFLSSFFIYRAITRFIKVTVKPDVLILHYLLNGTRTSVNYNEIIHVAAVEKYSTYLGTGTSFTGTCKTC